MVEPCVRRSFQVLVIAWRVRGLRIVEGNGRDLVRILLKEVVRRSVSYEMDAEMEFQRVILGSTSACAEVLRSLRKSCREVGEV
jgi:hypothetical protein